MISILWVILVSFAPIVLTKGTTSGPSLCDKPDIHSADRLPNNTYRVYREDYYWELIGLPDRVAKVNGPYKIWWPNMGPIPRGTAVTTVIGGEVDGVTYKYLRERYWSWFQNGTQKIGEKTGWKWAGIPRNGFQAVYNDGDLDGKGYSMLIGFAGIHVYYFNTKKETFRLIGSNNGHISGQFGEKFPPDVTAAFPFPSTDPKVKYNVYLFKREIYCFRPIIGENGCKTWRHNKELFGCDGDYPPIVSNVFAPLPNQTEDSGSGTGSDTGSDTGSTDDQLSNSTTHELPPNSEQKTTFGSTLRSIETTTSDDVKPQKGLKSISTPVSQNFVLLLFAIYLIQYFN